MALVNKATDIGRLGRPGDELAILNEVIDGYGGVVDPAVRTQVAIAMYNKHDTLGRLGRMGEQWAVRNEFAARFDHVGDPAVETIVTMFKQGG